MTDDFTEARYRDLVQRATATYKFVQYGEALDLRADGVALWRHDVDVSMQRARSLASIERDDGLMATYFIWLHSPHYNALEAPIVRMLRAIADEGHAIGLHFDLSFHDDAGDFAALVAREREILEWIVERPVDVLSLHDPTPEVLSTFVDDRIGGMVNAYSQSIRSRFTYCSDSNGFWRYTSLQDVLTATPPRLHVLTHPEWWTPDPLQPRERVSRAIDGRAAAIHSLYDANMRASGRGESR